MNWQTRDNRVSRRRALGVIAAGLMGVIVAAPAFAGQRSDPVPRSLGKVTRQIVDSGTTEKVGTVIISNENRTLDLVIAPGKVARYTIGVGRDGFEWTGTVRVGRKAEWPNWTPPADMLKRDPDLPESVPPGPYNPLGARAIYLYEGSRDTLYRIHGTNDGDSVGGYVSSGCFRMTNSDVIELYNKIRIGTKVVVK